VLKLPALPWPQDTVWVPRATTGHNAFTYTDDATNAQLKAMGADDAFHTVISLAPLARHINPGYMAWSAGLQSPLISIMKCNPQ
jgi:hypothetical protein